MPRSVLQALDIRCSIPGRMLKTEGTNVWLLWPALSLVLALLCNASMCNSAGLPAFGQVTTHALPPPRTVEAQLAVIGGPTPQPAKTGTQIAAPLARQARLFRDPHWNLTGAFHGHWKRTGNHLSDHMSDMQGVVSYHFKAWRTNSTELHYVQAALLLRDGSYTSSGDTRVTFEGVHDRLQNKVRMLSMHPGTSFVKSSANMTPGARNLWADIRQLRFHAEHRGRARRSQMFSAATVNAHCFFTVELDARRSPSSDGYDLTPHRIALNGTLASSDCQFDMNIAAASIDYDAHYNKALYFGAAATVVTINQIALLIVQMSATQTAMLTARVSVITVALQAWMDVILAVIFLSHGVIVEAFFALFAGAAFLKFLLVAVFEMRWLVEIWKAQLPPDSWTEPSFERQEVSTINARFYVVALSSVVFLHEMPTLHIPALFAGFSW